MSETRKWHAIQLTPRKEPRTVRLLLESGVDVLWPHYLAEVRGSEWVIDKSTGTNKRVQARGYGFRSWLPGNYAFVAGSLETVRHLRAENMGVSGIYYVGGRPLEIPFEAILDFRSIADPSGLIPRMKSPPPKMVAVKGENLISVIATLNLGRKSVAWATGLMSAAKAA